MFEEPPLEGWPNISAVGGRQAKFPLGPDIASHHLLKTSLGFGVEPPT